MNVFTHLFFVHSQANFILPYIRSPVFSGCRQVIFILVFLTDDRILFFLGGIVISVVNKSQQSEIR